MLVLFLQTFIISVSGKDRLSFNNNFGDGMQFQIEKKQHICSFQGDKMSSLFSYLHLQVLMKIV